MHLENDVDMLRSALKIDKEQKALCNKNYIQERNRNQGKICIPAQWFHNFQHRKQKKA